MNGWEVDFIANHRIAHLATVDSGERPHAVPVVYAFDGEKLYSPVDDKPKHTGPYQFARVRNILANHRVVLVIDDYDDDWTKLAWVQVRGNAIIKAKGEEYEKGIDLLTVKYPQYKSMPLIGKPLIIITPQKVVGWRAIDRQVPTDLEAKEFLGKSVTIQIDRPIGSRHPQFGFSYPVNYGSVPGIIGQDGDELDAYLLGVYEPVTSYEGKCIAIIHRTNDNDDKLVVVPEGLELTDDQIRALTDFQERFFRSVIIRNQFDALLSTLVQRRGE